MNTDMTPRFTSETTAAAAVAPVPRPVAPPKPARTAAQENPAPASSPPEAKPAEPMLRAVAAQIESWLQSSGRSLEFSVDDSSGCTVIVVRDASGELIRQIPSEEALRLANFIGNSSAILLDTKV